MATATVQHPSTALPRSTDTANFDRLAVNNASPKPRNVQTTLHYYKPNADGSPPEPSIVGRPETYERPADSHEVTIHDVRGRESEFSLDKQGFQIVKRAATEKKFLDDEDIKASYYPEVEQLLKDA